MGGMEMILSRSDSRRSAYSNAVYGCVFGALAGFINRDLDLPALVSFEHPQEPLVLLAAVVGALVGITRFRWLLGVAAIALTLLWAVVAFTPLSGWLAHGLARREIAEPADAVFVSFAGLRPGAQRMLEARTRALHGAELVARRKGSTLVVAESSLLPSVATARNMMSRLGVGGEALVAGRADNTREEAVALGDLARQKGWKRVLVVTSPIHSRRASQAMEHEGVTVVSTPSRESRFDLDNLDTSVDRLAAFGSVIHERLGIFVYARRGWLAGTSR
jgi:uncharacterized SAM-binding protein YcdF (DUF218 family)